MDLVILVNPPACAHIHVAHLGVSHLSVRKSHKHAAGLSFYKGALTHKLIHDGGLTLADRIVLAVLIQSITVQNH